MDILCKNGTAPYANKMCDELNKFCLNSNYLYCGPFIDCIKNNMVLCKHNSPDVSPVLVIAALPLIIVIYVWIKMCKDSMVGCGNRDQNRNNICSKIKLWFSNLCKCKCKCKRRNDNQSRVYRPRVRVIPATQEELPPSYELFAVTIINMNMNVHVNIESPPSYNENPPNIELDDTPPVYEERF